jgi:hypothetical protein
MGSIANGYFSLAANCIAKITRNLQEKHSRKLTFNQSISSAPTNDQGSKRVVITMDSPIQVLLEGESTSDASSKWSND